MSTVMYSPSSSNRGPSDYSRSQRAAAQKTENIRVIAGLWSAASVIYSAYFAYQLVSLVMGGIGGIAVAAVLLVSAGSMTFVAGVIFKALPDRRVRAVTYLCMSCVAISSFLIPGFAGMITIVSIGVTLIGGACYLLFVVSTRLFLVLRLADYKWLAIFIASTPVVGALFYVPSSLSDAGLTIHYSQAHDMPSLMAQQLADINSAISYSYGDSATLTYAIRKNRLYADISKDGKTQSVELNTRSIVRTPIPWLQWNLSKTLDRYLAADSSGSQLATLLRPINTALSGIDTVMVADGVLINHPQQFVLPGKRVLRSISMNQGRIGQNAQKWADPLNLTPQQIEVINAIPRNQDELERIDIAGGEWPHWRGFQDQFAKAIPEGVSKVARVTRAQALDALQTKKGVMFIIAHYDGYSIRLPNGEALTISDLDSVHEAIRRNHPRVFLFSCETARIQNAQSFAKSLLDHGAEAVVASTQPISAADALTLFQSFMNNVVVKHMPVSDAFQRAQEESDVKSLEVWVAELHRPGSAIFTPNSKTSRQDSWPS